MAIAPESLTAQRKTLPDSPGVYFFKDAQSKVIYVGKAASIRKRVGGHFSKPGGARGSLDMVAQIAEVDFIATETEAEALLARAALHPPAPPALQRPPARRQVVPLHRDLARRGLPARLLHARAAPAQPRVLRPLQQRQARARDARPARQDLPAPHLRRARARAGVRQPLPRLPPQALRGALRGLHLEGGVPREHRLDHRLPLGALPPHRARPREGDEAGLRGAGVRGGGQPPQPARRRCARCWSASASRTRPSARSTRSRWPPRTRTPTPRCSRCATACWPTARASTSRTRPGATRARWPRSSCSSTTRARWPFRRR